MGIACATCHEMRDEPHQLPAEAGSLDEIHADLAFDHGTNRCASCHDPEHYDRLRLADGTSIPMTDVMELCGQCHGPQRRDYLRGSHGGMRGHWDLSAGGRERNHCVDCHDPHVPAFPTYQPVFPPKDRFLTHTAGAHDG